MKDEKDPSAERGGRRERNNDPRRPGGMPVREFMRRVLATGVDAVQITEDGLKTLVGDVNPREAVSGLFDTVSKGTDTIQSVLVREARRYLDAINLRDELGDILSNYTIEIHANVNFVPREKEKAPRRRRTSRSRNVEEAKIEAENFSVRFVPKDAKNDRGDRGGSASGS